MQACRSVFYIFTVLNILFTFFSVHFHWQSFSNSVPTTESWKPNTICQKHNITWGQSNSDMERIGSIQSCGITSHLKWANLLTDQTAQTFTEKPRGRSFVSIASRCQPRVSPWGNDRMNYYFLIHDNRSFLLTEVYKKPWSHENSLPWCWKKRPEKLTIMRN